MRPYSGAIMAFDCIIDASARGLQRPWVAHRRMSVRDRYGKLATVCNFFEGSAAVARNMNSSLEEWVR